MGIIGHTFRLARRLRPPHDQVHLLGAFAASHQNSVVSRHNQPMPHPQVVPASQVALTTASSTPPLDAPANYVDQASDACFPMASECAVPEKTGRVRMVSGCPATLVPPMPTLVLSNMDVQQLHNISGSNSLCHPILQRGQNDLTCISRQTNTATANANQMRLTGLAVGK